MLICESFKRLIQKDWLMNDSLTNTMVLSLILHNQYLENITSLDFRKS